MRRQEGKKKKKNVPGTKSDSEKIEKEREKESDNKTEKIKRIK